MARPKKEGLDYFPLDVDTDQDDKIALVEAKYGVTGFAVVIKLFMKIYKEGYFYKWGEKEHLLFSSRVNVDINTVSDVVNDCIKWGLFDQKIYESEKILTSEGIQKRYLDAVTRRKEVTLEGKYLLINPLEYIGNSKIKVYIINVDGKRVNVNINDSNGKHQVDSNPQSKVKESKVKESKEENLKNNDEEIAQRQKSIVDKLIANNLLTPGGINETLRDDIADIFNKFGFENPEDVIDFGIKTAARGNGRTWRFVYKRIWYWRQQGVHTVKDAERLEDAEFEHKQVSPSKKFNKKSQRQEVVPEWMHKQKQDKPPEDPEEVKRRAEYLDEYLKSI
ncbi:Lin1244/Lin1753 domain-containing protein [Sporolactobacillus terrae]|uniref:Lin1244/Lin1753 domain-containing protein n=1 Tax=Sporolactobacillus terrae TaxID=269673 RepID=UPI000683DF53|nr:Lin1244/Lin1753 domain-containing protein [Sporolactobacillus terrae]